MDAKKIRVRANLKGQLTRYASFVKDNMEGGVDSRIIESRFGSFRLLLPKFEAIQSEIEDLASESEIGSKEQVSERIKFEDEFYAVEEQFIALLNMGRGNQPDAEATLPDRVQRVRLPQIELPSFDGRLTDYRSFREVFGSLIDRNDDMHDVDKLLYLRASLKGEAFRVIESLPTTAESYGHALVLLKNRYENVRCLKNAHLVDLFGLPDVESNSAKSLRNIIDTVTKATMSLSAMGEKVQYWDSILVFQITSKLDTETRRLFENHFETDEVPTFLQLKEFIANRCATLERLETDKKSTSKVSSRPSSGNKCFVSKQDANCDLCQAAHPLWKCPLFKKMTVVQRREKVKTLKRCFKCMRADHLARDCTFRDCSKCSQGHNDMLHIERRCEKSSEAPGTGPISLALTKAPVRSVLLFTVLIFVKSKLGERILVRALLDSGSQVNFITLGLLRRLRLTPKKMYSSVEGIGENPCELKSHIELNLMSRHEDFSISIGAYVINKITSNLPQKAYGSMELFDLTGGMLLADPNFHSPGPIDMLLSNEVFIHILKDGVRSSTNNIKMINTSFGWIVGGSVSDCSTEQSPVTCLANLNQDLDCDFDLTKFWELEEIPKGIDIDPVEQRFRDTYRRDGDGRFVVKLPLTGSVPEDCQYSRSFAIRQFQLLEKRFERCPDFRKEYDAFMSDYLNNGFIESVQLNETDSKQAYYLPHHGVVKKDSLTTKLRIVFSGKDTSAGCLAINQFLETGPKLQNDLVLSLLRFRTHRIAFAADIEKMYCQILIAEEHRDYLRFFYRFANETTVGVYRLRTLPFGLNCSPFIAIRCLRELGFLNEDKYPVASRIILEDTYVDDVLSGSDSPLNAERLCRDLIEICSQGGFCLRKWKTNSKDLLSSLDELYEFGSKEFVTDSSTSKVLGMKWDSSNDILSYSINSDFSGPCTKRKILSWIAGVFNPLGLLSPVIITGKILIQRLWILKLDWDEEVPLELKTVWKRWTEEFSMLKTFSVPRIVNCDVNTKILAFSDASEKAYGCAIYLVNGDQVRLVFAKSRVAPVKVISLARLELCAAVLCARAVNYILKCFNVDPKRCLLFSDSEIVLAWIFRPAYTWKTFVANRVSEIQSLLPESSWHHVCSNENPADLVSRGVYPSDLLSHGMWWNGPIDVNKLLTSKCFGGFSTTLESKNREFAGINLVSDVDCENGNGILSSLLKRFSDVDKVKRIYAWILRFVSCVRSSESGVNSKYLSLKEMDHSFSKMLRFVQRRHFGETIERLENGKSLKSRDSLLALNPFLDEDLILRVGGRLRNSDLPFSQRHPIILPKNDDFTYSIIRNEHVHCDHLGTVGLISMLRQRFWIINSRTTVRNVLRKCIRCFRSNPIKGSQLMGSLPTERTSGGHVFGNVGIDLCGPFFVQPTRRRGNITTKCYVALFICMATKAVHLDTVFDLTSDSFLATFRRFSSRRGLPQVVLTDNATNFVGLRNRLNEWYELLKSSEFQEKVHADLIKDRIVWKFIPPRSPNFGGLWESHIKSFKSLFLKCVGESRLTIEEFCTLLVQVEATLNSRSLCGVTESIDDLDSLTPGHFLIGRPLKMLPCPSSHNFNGSLSKRWTYVQDVYRNFWRRWSVEFVQSLQNSIKNKKRSPNVQIGDIGLVVDDVHPPLRWKLGRVMEVIPGKDQLTRVIIIKTENGIIKRGIRGFCRFDFASTQNGGEYVQSEVAF